MSMRVVGYYGRTVLEHIRLNDPEAFADLTQRGKLEEHMLDLTIRIVEQINRRTDAELSRCITPRDGNPEHYLELIEQVVPRVERDVYRELLYTAHNTPKVIELEFPNVTRLAR